MNKKIDNKTYSKKLLKEIKGFEDVFHDYVKDEESKNEERKEREEAKAGEQYELQTFLEKESDRLKALEIFFTKKIPLRVNFSQSDKLIHHQIERKNLLKDKLTRAFVRLDSPLQKNLAQLMNTHFS